MKVLIEQGDKKYIYIIIGVVILICIGIFQYRSLNSLGKVIDSKNEANAKQAKEIILLEAKIAEMSDNEKKLMAKADSLQSLEKKYKENYYATDKNFKLLLGTYARASDDDKWRAFAGAVRE